MEKFSTRLRSDANYFIDGGIVEGEKVAAG